MQALADMLGLSVHHLQMILFITTICVMGYLSSRWQDSRRASTPAPAEPLPDPPSSSIRHLNFVKWLGYVGILAITVVSWQARATGDHSQFLFYGACAIAGSGVLIGLSSLWWVYGEHGLLAAYPDASEAQLQSQTMLAWMGLCLNLAGVVAAVLAFMGRLDQITMMYIVMGTLVLQGFVMSGMDRLVRYAGDRPLW